jgi:glycosyltransferase involved in cell wall biosynthesis
LKIFDFDFCKMPDTMTNALTNTVTNFGTNSEANVIPVQRRNSPAEELNGRDIVCIATQEWEAHWTPVQQVMCRLAPQNRVIYIEPYHPPMAWLKSHNYLLKKRRDENTSQLREVQPNLFVYTPNSWYLPFNMKSTVSRAWNGPAYREEIRELLATWGVTKPWLWAFFAQNLSVLDLQFEYFIYDCVDYWPAFFPSPREKKYVGQVNDELARRADLVFVGSNPLLERQGHLNPNTFVVPHAADIAHFAKAADPATVVPADLEAIPHPRIGFVGMMDAIRFDTGLIQQLAANPDYHVVIIGGVNGAASNLVPKSANVHWLGMKAVAELPAYLKGIDVCIMPYLLNEATRNIYPLKLHEYMATGKPVVTTAIPAVADFADYFYIASSPEEFLAGVEQALKEQNPQLNARRRECARKHSWETHLLEKTRLIQQHLLCDR